MAKWFRRVIKVSAADSPNVKLGLIQQRKGKQPTHEVLVPGILTFAEYLHRRATWDKVRQTVGLDAQFWQGADILLFPPLWLDGAHLLVLTLQGKPRKARALGVDPAEGGDSTAMTVVDELGVLEQVSKKTPDTNVIGVEAIQMMRRWGLEPHQVLFDAGGGGKQIADALRGMKGGHHPLLGSNPPNGYPVRTVAFGAAVALEPRRGLRMIEEKKEVKEEHYAYVNRRAQMYGELSLLLDPANIGNKVEGLLCQGFAIPEELAELRRQMAPIPKQYTEEGRLKLMPKDKPKTGEGSTQQCLKDLLGCSPDELDSLVLAVHGLLHKGGKVMAGVAK